MATQRKEYSCDFEIFGNVQGVFFRKFTEKQARVLGIRGWCMNTDHGTVKGQIEGELAQVAKMKLWLEKKGSPKARIDKALFTEVKEIKNPNFQDFIIRT